jgi:hypothetical protein
MNFPTSGAPALWTLVAAVVGSVGMLAALKARSVVEAERKRIKDAKANLAGSEAWAEAHNRSDLELDKWLSSRGIHPDSYIADIVHTCWAAWLGGRAASLTELHALVGRRERSRVSTKLSGGIAALLLVIGVVGTLSSVEPILTKFQFKVSADGELQGTAESTQLINSLLNDLGVAFWPSMTALFFTVAVVSVRGLYLLSLHQFSLEMDRFATRTILPRFTPRTITEEYAEVKSTLRDLSENILRRETDFAGVVGDLKSVAADLGPVIKALEKTAQTSDAAAEKLSSRARSIAEGLKESLGDGSPIHRALSGFDGIFDKTNTSMEKLAMQVESMGSDHRTDRIAFRKTIAQLEVSLERIGTDHAVDKQQVAETLALLQNDFANLGETASKSSQEAVRHGLDKLEESLMRMQEAHDALAREANADLKKQMDVGLESIANEASKSLDGLTRTIASMEGAAAAAMWAQAERSAAMVNESAARLKALLERAAAEQGPEQVRGGKIFTPVINVKSSSPPPFPPPPNISPAAPLAPLASEAGRRIGPSHARSVGMERAKSHGVPSALPPESTDSHEPDPASGQKEEEKSIFQKIFGR